MNAANDFSELMLVVRTSLRWQKTSRFLCKFTAVMHLYSPFSMYLCSNALFTSIYARSVGEIRHQHMQTLLAAAMGL